MPIRPIFGLSDPIGLERVVDLGLLRLAAGWMGAGGDYRPLAVDPADPDRLLPGATDSGLSAFTLPGQGQFRRRPYGGFVAS